MICIGVRHNPFPYRFSNWTRRNLQSVLKPCNLFPCFLALSVLYKDVFKTLTSPPTTKTPARDRHERKCLICNHPERDAIEEELLHRLSPAEIASHYEVSLSGIYRHAQAMRLFAKPAGRMGSIPDVKRGPGSRISNRNKPGNRNRLNTPAINDLNFSTRNKTRGVPRTKSEKLASASPEKPTRRASPMARLASGLKRSAAALRAASYGLEFNPGPSRHLPRGPSAIQSPACPCPPKLASWTPNDPGEPGTLLAGLPTVPGLPDPGGLSNFPHLTSNLCRILIATPANRNVLSPSVTNETFPSNRNKMRGSPTKIQPANGVFTDHESRVTSH